MNRGFNNNLGGQGGRPNNNYAGQGNQSTVVDYRERANQSDRRYDNFYSGGGGANRNGGAGGGVNNRNAGRGGGAISNRNAGGGGNWNGPQQQQQQGFNQQLPARGVGVGPINVNGQVLSAIQQQNLINALVSNNQQQQQQQQNIRMQQQQNNQLQGNQFRRPVGGAGNRGAFGGFNPRAGDKRSMAQSGNFNNNRQAGKNNTTKFQPKKAKDSPKPKVPPKTAPKVVPAAPKAAPAVIVVEEEIEIPDDEVEIPDTLKEEVEKLRARTGEIERNAVDEDVEKLSTFSYNGKGYHCITCDIMLLKQVSFNNHLNHKSHVMKVIDARTSKNYKEARAILDIDLSKDSWLDDSELARSIIFKQAKVDMRQKKAKELKEKAEYNKTPSNFYKFNMEMRKCVVKQDDEVIITSLVESTVGVKDFTGGKFFGCEFVRAVTGFHCRLCSINIREAKGVLPHIQTKLHKNNYAKYLVNNPEYENMQNVQNQDLHDIMLQHEGKSVVLAESSAAESSRFLSLLDNEVVRIPSIMDPEIKKKEAEEKAKAEAEEAAKAKAEAGEGKEELEAEATGEEKGDEGTEEAGGDEGTTENDEEMGDAAEAETDGPVEEAESMEEEESESVEEEESESVEDEEAAEGKESSEDAVEEVTADASDETEELSFAEDTPAAPDATTEEPAEESPKEKKTKAKKVSTKVKGK